MSLLKYAIIFHGGFMKKLLLTLPLLLSVFGALAFVPGNTPGAQYINYIYEQNKADFDARAVGLAKMLHELGYADVLFCSGFKLGDFENFCKICKRFLVLEKIACEVISKNPQFAAFVNIRDPRYEERCRGIYNRFFSKLVSYEYFKLWYAFEHHVKANKVNTQLFIQMLTAVIQEAEKEIRNRHQ
jgi:hypothetical protein